jgi:hypothetical protein
MSSSGDTAASSTSTTRLDFSSMVEVIMPWPPIITTMNSRMPMMKGSARFRPGDPCCVPSGETITVRGRATRVAF